MIHNRHMWKRIWTFWPQWPQHIALALERKEFDSRLQDQQILLETILESSPVGICLVEDRIFKWVNSQIVSMLGYGKKSRTHRQGQRPDVS